MMAMILMILINKSPKCYKIQIHFTSVFLQILLLVFFYKKSKTLTLFISSSYSFFSSPSAAITCFGAIIATKQLLS